MTLAFGRNRNRHCSRCGRELEDPASEERGVGPICAAKDTVLFARAIPANYAGATAILLGMPYMTALPQEVQAMFLEVRDEVVARAARATSANTDTFAIHLNGQDLRGLIKKLDWMLSHRMPDPSRKHLIMVVRFLGYVEVAAVLSQEASTTPATVAFDETTGKLSLKGKSCKGGFFKIRRIPGSTVPRVRGSEEPYTVPANQADAFLEAVRDFWPLYQGDLEEIRQKAQEWLRTRPVVVAPSQPVAASGSPPVSLQMHTLTGYDAGEWMEISFPWIVSKQAEMYALVNDLKAAVPYRDRKYNPQTRSWMFRVSHREAVTVILRRLFTV